MLLKLPGHAQPGSLSRPGGAGRTPSAPYPLPPIALWLRVLHLLRPHHIQLEDKATQPQRVLAAPGHARKRGASPDLVHSRGRPGAQQPGKWDEKAWE